MAETAKRYSPLVSVGILFIVLGFLGPAATIKYAGMTSSPTLKWLLPILTDSLRVGFFLGIAILIIGLFRSWGVKGFGSAPPAGEQHARVGVSRTGVTSLLLGFLALMLIGSAMVLSAGYAVSHPGSNNSGVFLVAGSMIIAGLLFAVVGAILGLIGTAQSKKRRGFGVAGLLLNTLLFLGFLVAIYIGGNM